MPTHPSRPNLEFYKKQAKALLKLQRLGDSQALKRIQAQHSEFARLSIESLGRAKFLLADAQLVIARENGAASWPELKRKIAFVRVGSGQLIGEWSDALSSRDLKRIEALLSSHEHLKHEEFFPRQKLPHYHSATYGPLLWAVWMEDLGLVRLLLEHGADPNHEAQSCLPLLVASREMSDLLIAHGADVNRYCVNGGTPLQWGVGDIQRVRYLIAQGADVNLAKPNSGETPLMLLMGCDDEDGAVAIAELLVRHGADLNARTRSGLDDEPIFNHGNDQNISQGRMTALHLAAGFGRSKLAAFLLQHGADSQAKTVSRRTVFFGPEDRPFPFEPFEGEVPLDWAVRNGHVQVIRLLGGDLLDDLYWAAAAGAQEQVIRLLRKGANVNAVDVRRGKRPLEAAIAGKHRGICEILLAHGAQWNGDVAAAIELGLGDVVEEAANSDASLKERLLARPDKLLEWALRSSPEQRTLLERLADSEPHTELDIVLAVGLRDAARVERVVTRHPGAIAAGLATVPVLACWCVWDPTLVQSLLEQGADIEARDHVLQGTPLHWAIQLDQAQSLRLLLTAGANTNAILTIGDADTTPLLLVVQQRTACSLELVEPLLQGGADPNWQMHNGYTALDILEQRWGQRPQWEYEFAVGVLKRFQAKSAEELATSGELGK